MTISGSGNCGIIGFGELGRQLLLFISAAGPPHSVCLFDDALYASGHENSYPFQSYVDERFSSLDFYIALGYRHLPTRVETSRCLRQLGRHMPSLIHPTAFVHSSSRIGPGCIIYPMSNVDKEVELQDGVLLNNSVTISHNCSIGEGAYLSPGVVLSGFVTVGRATFLGTGTVVSNGIRIGNSVKVGIGTVVTGDIEDGRSAIGNPMRVLDRDLVLE